MRAAATMPVDLLAPIAGFGSGTSHELPFPDRCNGLIRLHLTIPVGRERFCPPPAWTARPHALRTPGPNPVNRTFARAFTARFGR